MREVLYAWVFTLDTGEEITAKFTDSEIEQMKLDYPTVKWK